MKKESRVILVLLHGSRNLIKTRKMSIKINQMYEKKHEKTQESQFRFSIEDYANTSNTIFCRTTH